MPICEVCHWQLLAIVHPSKDTCRLLLFDSTTLNPHNADSIEAFADSVICGTHNVPHLQWHHPSVLRCQVPCHPNGFDCGVYVLKFLQMILNADKAFLLMLETPPANPLRCRYCSGLCIRTFNRYVSMSLIRSLFTGARSLIIPAITMSQFTRWRLKTAWLRTS